MGTDFALQDARPSPALPIQTHRVWYTSPAKLEGTAPSWLSEWPSDLADVQKVPVVLLILRVYGLFFPSIAIKLP